MQNIINLVVRALRVISFIVIISGFLTISLNEAWSDSEKEESVLVQEKQGWKEAATQENKDVQLYLRLSQRSYKAGDIKQAKIWLKEAATRGSVVDRVYLLAERSYKEGDIEQSQILVERSSCSRTCERFSLSGSDILQSRRYRTS